MAVRLGELCRGGTLRPARRGRARRAVRRGHARRRRSARAAAARRVAICSGQCSRTTSAMRSSLASSTMKRGSTVAGSATTRRRRQAGPPPFAIDWRTSTTSTRRIGPLPARWRSIHRHTDGVSRASLGTIRVICAVGQRDELRVEQIRPHRILERHVGGGDLDIFEAGHRARAARRSAAPCPRRPARARTGRVRWRPRRRRYGTRRRRSPPPTADEHHALGASRCSRAIAFDAWRCCRAGKAPPVTP